MKSFLMTRCCFTDGGGAFSSFLPRSSIYVTRADELLGLLPFLASLPLGNQASNRQLYILFPSFCSPQSFSLFKTFFFKIF